MAALALALAMLAAAAAASFLLHLDASDLRSLGYAGVFATAVIGSASIALPLPSAVAVMGSSAFLDGVWGIPAWFLVALVAAAGNTIGELSGYLAGVGGRGFLEKRPVYIRIERWMRQRGGLTLFVLAIVPNPFFDVAGIIAGSVRMPVTRFLLIVFHGKLVKNVVFAVTGVAGLAALGGLLS
jgi:membrane protein YqaA with SNARE-associated domain